jgi:glycosyltransferase involved in cell wall biosynthesis
MEALCLEVPVIASAARGSRELVGSSRGRVVPIGDTAQMAAAMDELAHSPEDRRAMGNRGRQLMVERYDVKRIIDEHERLYDELISNGRRSDGPRHAVEA